MLIGAVVLTGVAAGFFLLTLWQGWFWFRPPAFPGAAEQPGSAAGMTDEWVVDAHEMDLLEQRMLTLLDEKGLLVSWYRLAGRTGTPAAVRSGERRVIDQLLYGQYLLEQRREGDFTVWWQSFARACLTSEGVVSRLPGEPARLDDMPAVPGDTADEIWRVNLLAARVLAQSCVIWPDKARLDTVTRLSDQMLDRLVAQPPTDFETARPTPVPILDPGATPTPKPTVAAEPSATMTTEPALSQPSDAETITSSDAADAADDISASMQVLRLASIDLLAARLLTAIDSRWQDVYEQWLVWIQGGYLGDDLPLYAWAVDPRSIPTAPSYMPFTGEFPAVYTEDTVRTLLHLAEVGQLKETSLQWLKNQLYNSGKIYEYYHIVQTTPLSGNESIAAYAMIARIARIQSDQPLYDLVVERLLWHQATNAKSAALSALYRQNETGSITVYAGDNLLGLLAMR